MSRHRMLRPAGYARRGGIPLLRPIAPRAMPGARSARCPDAARPWGWARIVLAAPSSNRSHRPIRSCAQLMNTDVLSTRQVATLLGVGEATVKRWADAGEIDCFRTPGGHRKFRLRDVTSFVQTRQYETPGVLPEAAPPGAGEPGEAAIEHFKAAALRGEAAALVAQPSRMRLRGYQPATLFHEAVAPALQRIGAETEKRTPSIAEEHVASQAVVGAHARPQPLAEPPGEPVPPDRGTAIVAAVAGEQHDIAARMAACPLRAPGLVR